MDNLQERRRKGMRFEIPDILIMFFVIYATAANMTKTGKTFIHLLAMIITIVLLYWGGLFE